MAVAASLAVELIMASDPVLLPWIAGISPDRWQEWTQRSTSSRLLRNCSG